jgi:hypothetical protein
MPNDGLLFLELHGGTDGFPFPKRNAKKQQAAAVSSGEIFPVLGSNDCSGIFLKHLFVFFSSVNVRSFCHLLVLRATLKV